MIRYNVSYILRMYGGLHGSVTLMDDISRDEIFSIMDLKVNILNKGFNGKAVTFGAASLTYGLDIYHFRNAILMMDGKSTGKAYLTISLDRHRKKADASVEDV